MDIIIKYRNGELINIIKDKDDIINTINKDELVDIIGDDNPEYFGYFGYPKIVCNEFKFNVKFGEKIIPICEGCSNKLDENNKWVQFIECINCGCICTIENCERRVKDEIKPLCIDFKVDIEDKSELDHKYSDIVNIYKIKIKDIYAIMICVLSFETNTWTRVPRNYFKTDVYLYNNQENRNDAYTKYLNGTMKHKY